MFSQLLQMGRRLRRRQHFGTHTLDSPAGSASKGPSRRLTPAGCALSVVLLLVAALLLQCISSSRHRQQSSRAATGQPPPRNTAAPGAAAPAYSGPALYTYRLVREYPHDPAAFTQGLQFDRRCSRGAEGEQQQCRDILWESTGLNGRSSVREVELETGKVLRQKLLPHSDFGEGLTRFGDRLYQVTWRSPRAFSYHIDDFDDAVELVTPLRDGWGITSDNVSLIVGDSSPTLAWLDPTTLHLQRTVEVRDGGALVPWLNELEWIDGAIWGNVWQKDCLARIDPATGTVTAWALLHGLDAQLPSDGHMHRDVLNGIAWDEDGRRLFVTGKLWPKLFEIELQSLETNAAKLLQTRSLCVPKNTHIFF